MEKIFDFFCTENGCNGMFSSQLELEQYSLSSLDSFSCKSTARDSVNIFFFLVEKIKTTSHFLTNVSSTPAITNEKDVNLPWAVFQGN